MSRSTPDGLLNETMDDKITGVALDYAESPNFVAALDLSEILPKLES